LIAEIGYAQAEAVRALFAAAGWREASIVKDYGKQDRVLVARP
jgi:methylase of polypeptide subunit release factors